MDVHRDRRSALRARFQRLAALAVVALMLVGCGFSHPGSGIADRIRNANSPIVREVALLPAAFSQADFDQIQVYIVDEATDAQALDLWCTVVVPAGISQLPARAVMFRKGGALAPEGGRADSKLILTDPVVCPAVGPSVT